MTVPKLRFPEFRDAGEWNNELLKELYSFKSTNSYSRDQLSYENGNVKNIHYGDIHTKFSTLFNIRNESVPFINPSQSLEKIKPDCYCVEGDIIFADASEDLEDIGKSIEIVHLNNEKLLSGLHTLLARQKNNTFIVGFGGYLFQSNWIRNQIQKESQGTKVLGISATRLSNINIFFPANKKEQQKIADCLTSLDDRITAETQKLNTLKAHKKGLMQQLFPAEGETVPKLRFPEFRDAGEWEEKSFYNLLIDVLDFRGRTPKKLGMEWGGGNVISLSANNVKNGYIDFNAECNLGSEDLYEKWMGGVKIEKGDIVFTMEAPLGNALLIPDSQKYILSQRVVVFKTKKEKVDNSFLIQLIWSDIFQKAVHLLSTGSTAKGINQKNLKSVNVEIPTLPEQQKIADCLTSLDDRITAETQKLNTLKAHKKGLMQQLFPSVEEVKR